jgi:uncharacterized protein YndB with AHSA1/START domain
LDRLEDEQLPEHRFVTERRVQASVDQAYAAWTQPVLLRRWFGTVVEADLRVGGKYRVENHEDGQVFKHKGEYRVLEPGRRVVKTFVFDGDGELAEYAKGFSDEMVTITFRALGPKLTLVTLTNSWNGRGYNEDEKENLDRGWSDWLSRYERALAES